MDLQEYVNNDNRVLGHSFLVQIYHILPINFLYLDLIQFRVVSDQLVEEQAYQEIR